MNCDGDEASAGVDELEFCREWEAVYAAICNGPSDVAEAGLDLFLARYPADGVAGYQRSISHNEAGPLAPSDPAEPVRDVAATKSHQ